MRPRRQRIHPDEDALLALADGEGPGRTDVSTHVSECAACSERLQELHETRRLLESLAGEELQPQADLAQRALASLRLRNTAIGNINEVFAVLRTLLLGFAELLGSTRPGQPSRPTKRRDES